MKYELYRCPIHGTRQIGKKRYHMSASEVLINFISDILDEVNYHIILEEYPEEFGGTHLLSFDDYDEAVSVLRNENFKPETHAEDVDEDIKTFYGHVYVLVDKVEKYMKAKVAGWTELHGYKPEIKIFNVNL